MGYRPLLDPPPNDERTHIILYHDGVNVISEKKGRHDAWVKIGEYLYDHEQFAIAVQARARELSQPNGSDNDGGGSADVSEPKQDGDTVSASENPQPASGKRGLYPSVFKGRNPPIGETGTQPIPDENPDDTARG